MPLMDITPMLKLARSEGWAVGAFHAENMEMIQAVIGAAESLRAPAILCLTPDNLSYAPTKLYVSCVQALADEASVPIGLQLDDCASYTQAAQALFTGFTSVMLRSLGWGEAVEWDWMRRVTETYRKHDGHVTGEIRWERVSQGRLSDEGLDEREIAQAVDYVERTGVSSLSMDRQSVEGMDADRPGLLAHRMEQVCLKVPVPVMLRIRQGISDVALTACVRSGVCAVNIERELHNAFTGALRKALAADEQMVDPKVYGAKGREAVEQVAMELIAVLGGEGKDRACLKESFQGEP